MANMSYCRFENTLGDMRDCLHAIQSSGSVENYLNEEDPSSYERGAIREMLEIVQELAQELES